MQKDLELLKRCEKEVDARLSDKRLEHVYSVSNYAKKMAKIYGVCEFDAQIAGLLHDWDKLYKDEELIDRMKQFNIPIPEHVEYLFPVLHSFTGAKAVREVFPQLSDEIESAIWHHSLGGSELCPLDMVIFVADAIEPLRSANKRPDLEKIRSMVGASPLEEVYFETYTETMRSLVNRKRCIHPDAFKIWNNLVRKFHPIDPSKQGRCDAVL